MHRYFHITFILVNFTFIPCQVYDGQEKRNEDLPYSLPAGGTTISTQPLNASSCPVQPNAQPWTRQGTASMMLPLGLGDVALQMETQMQWPHAAGNLQDGLRGAYNFAAARMLTPAPATIHTMPQVAANLSTANRCNLELLRALPVDMDETTLGQPVQPQVWNVSQHNQPAFPQPAFSQASPLAVSRASTSNAPQTTFSQADATTNAATTNAATTNGATIAQLATGFPHAHAASSSLGGSGTGAQNTTEAGAKVIARVQTAMAQACAVSIGAPVAVQTGISVGRLGQARPCAATHPVAERSATHFEHVMTSAMPIVSALQMPLPSDHAHDELTMDLLDYINK